MTMNNNENTKYKKASTYGIVGSFKSSLLELQ